jgi:site-specific DNA-methyltransferase (adenine-specific)
MTSTGTTTPRLSPVLFSSKSDNWPTPQAFFDALDEEFGFVLDACASATNRKTPAYYGLDHAELERRDGLAGDWAADARRLGGAVWMNPVYGRTIGKWMAKAAATAAAGATVVCLVPSRTGTRWFHDHVLANDADVRYVKGRLKFGDATHAAPFDSLVIVFRPPSGQAQAAVESASEVDAMPQPAEDSDARRGVTQALVAGERMTGALPRAVRRRAFTNRTPNVASQVIGATARRDSARQNPGDPEAGVDMTKVAGGGLSAAVRESSRSRSAHTRDRVWKPGARMATGARGRRSTMPNPPVAENA